MRRAFLTRALALLGATCLARAGGTSPRDSDTCDMPAVESIAAPADRLIYGQVLVQTSSTEWKLLRGVQVPDRPAQPRLFYDSFEDAVRQVVAECGGPKLVGAALWPAKTADAARTRLLDCLNPERQEKLGGDEMLMLMRMGRSRGCHAILEWFNQEAGYVAPVPINPDDERDELQRQFHENVQSLHKLATRIERIGKR